MSEFGQTLPATPQIYSNQALFTFTKAGFTHHICRVLKTVGMIPLLPAWNYDALDPANAEFIGIEDQGNASTYLFPFDFPDSSSFEINNELWRPFIAVVYYVGNLTAAGSSNSNADYWRIELGIRKAGAENLNAARGRWRQFTANVFGFGAESDTVTNNGTGGVGDLSRGMAILKPDWKPYASYSGSGDVNLLSIKNLFCYLGPAGLFLYAGTGSARSQFGDILAAGFGFGGARLPNRSVTPDLNLNRINPVVHLPLLETETEIWNNVRLATIIHGMQHDQKGSANWIVGEIRNLENSEIPFYPDRRPFSIPSPRKLPSGEGAHILGRLVVLPKYLFGDDTDLYGPVVTQLSASDTRPSYSEVFACPNLRLADANAPLGDFQDPDTLDNWRIVPYPAVGMTLGLYSENAAVTSVLSVGTKTLLTTRDYDLTSINSTGTSAFNPAVSVVSVPAGATGSIAQGTVSAGAGTARWVSVTGEDILRLDMTPFTSSVTLQALFTITLPTSDLPDAVYEFRFDARVRGGAEDQNGFRLKNRVSGIDVTRTINDGSTDRTVIRSSGANTGHYAYDYATYTTAIVADASAATRSILIIFEADRTSINDAAIIEITNLQLLRYRYL